MLTSKKLRNLRNDLVMRTYGSIDLTYTVALLLKIYQKLLEDDLLNIKTDMIFVKIHIYYVYKNLLNYQGTHCKLFLYLQDYNILGSVFMNFKKFLSCFLTPVGHSLT